MAEPYANNEDAVVQPDIGMRMVWMWWMIYRLLRWNNCDTRDQSLESDITAADLDGNTNNDIGSGTEQLGGMADGGLHYSYEVSNPSHSSSLSTGFKDMRNFLGLEKIKGWKLIMPATIQMPQK